MKADKQIKVREPRTYAPDSPHSFFGDVVRAQKPLSEDHLGAKARLERHWVEMQGEFRANGRSAESRYFAKACRNATRSTSPARSQAEFRAMTTGGSSGGVFVTPQYLVKEYHEYREYPPAFLEQLPCQPLPSYGLVVNIPMIEGPAAVVAQASEGTLVGETDPSGGYHTATLVTYAGQITASQQLMDRSGPSQTFDTVAYKQMRQEYDAAVDAAIITAALAGAQSITDSTVYAASTFIPNLYGDLYNAGQKLETAAGTKLRPTHVFFQPTQWGFIASQTGSDQRPILLPNSNPHADVPMRIGVDDPAPGGYTGYNLGAVPAFTDGNIPATSGDSTIIVLNASSVYPFVDDEPNVMAFEQTVAGNLQVVLRMHGYAAAVITHTNGVCSISGAAYSLTPTFAG